VTRPKIRTTDEGFSALYRRVGSLEVAAKEYLALLQALEDIIRNFEGKEDDFPCTEDEAEDVRLRIHDALACLGEKRRERAE